MSSLTWLAHSEAERRRTLDVIKLLGEPGTLDEIGIGGIRDAFADLLFPGTSTIQTRARYFLFVPWIYLRLERGAPLGEAGAEARRLEVRLIDALMGSEDTGGVIGREARARLQRLPSAVYWQGLESWGIRLLHTPIRAYHRRLERAHFGPAMAGDERSLLVSAWHGELPPAPDEFPREADLALRPAEAGYLRDRIMTRHPGTMLAALAAERSQSRADAPWEVAPAELRAAGERVHEQIHHARAFGVLMHGAQLLYNLMLAQASQRESEMGHYGDRLARWADQILAEEATWVAWREERQRFWEIVHEGNPRLHPQTRGFAEQWFDLALGGDLGRLAADPGARALIAERERKLKRRLARLANPTALEAWGGASGSEPLLFRWPQARTLLADIAAPLADPTRPAPSSGDQA